MDVLSLSNNIIYRSNEFHLSDSKWQIILKIHDLSGILRIEYCIHSNPLKTI